MQHTKQVCDSGRRLERGQAPHRWDRSEARAAGERGRAIRYAHVREAARRAAGQDQAGGVAQNAK